MENAIVVKDFIRFIEVKGIRNENEIVFLEGLYRIQEIPNFGAQIFTDKQVFISRTPYKEVLDELNRIQDHNFQQSQILETKNAPRSQTS